MKTANPSPAEGVPATTTSAPALPPAVQERLDEIERILEDPPAPGLLPSLEQELTRLAKAFAIDPAGETAAVLPGREVKPRGKPLALTPDPTQLPLVAGIRIEPDIEWFFREGARVMVRNEEWSTDVVTAPSIAGLLLRPNVVEAPRESKDVRSISAHVRLTLRMHLSGQTNPAESERVELPLPQGPLPTKIPVEPVVVPTVLALFRHRRFEPRAPGLKGFVLLVLDPDPRRPGEDLLKALNDATANLPLDAGKKLTQKFDLPAVVGAVDRGVLKGKNVIAFLAERIGEHHPNVRAEGRNRIEELKRIGIPTGESGLDAGNAASSLIFIGVGPNVRKGRTVNCWSGRLGDYKDPYFTLKTGPAGFAVVEDLHDDQPPTVPAGQLAVGKKPGAANTFGDALSAIEFV